MNKYKIISSGSKGNAVLYHNSILVDIGVSHMNIKPYSSQIQIVLLTHVHKDHINTKTLEKLQFDNPSVRIACCDYMINYVNKLRNIDIVQPGCIYDYGKFRISPFVLFHDVKNVGWRIFKDDYKIFHATDTAHLEGIEAKNYDLYCIEANYDSEYYEELIRQKTERGEYCYEKGAMNSHLSEHQYHKFIFENANEQSEVVRLHESTNK